MGPRCSCAISEASFPQLDKLCSGESDCFRRPHAASPGSGLLGLTSQWKTARLPEGGS